MLLLWYLLLSAWYDLRTAKIPIWLLVLFGITGALGLLTGAWQEYSGVLAAFLPGIFLLLVTICTGGAAGAGDGCFFYCVSLLSWLLRNYRAFSMRPFFLRDVQSGDGSMGIYSWY